MTITPEMRRAFRIAYDAMEKIPEMPTSKDGCAKYFADVGNHMRKQVNENGDNLLMKKILVAVYEYLETTVYKSLGA